MTDRYEPHAPEKRPEKASENAPGKNSLFPTKKPGRNPGFFCKIFNFPTTDAA
jgi:hypothetical protein